MRTWSTLLKAVGCTLRLVIPLSSALLFVHRGHADDMVSHHWSVDYPRTTAEDRLNAVAALLDRKTVIVGDSSADRQGIFEHWTTSFSADGKQLNAESFPRHVGTSQKRDITSLVPDPDGGFLAAGVLYNKDDEWGQAAQYIWRFDADGKTVWQLPLENQRQEYVIEHIDYLKDSNKGSGIFATPSRCKNPSYLECAFVTQFTEDGRLTWKSAIGDQDEAAMLAGAYPIAVLQSPRLGAVVLAATYPLSNKDGYIQPDTDVHTSALFFMDRDGQVVRKERLPDTTLPAVPGTVAAIAMSVGYLDNFVDVLVRYQKAEDKSVAYGIITYESEKGFSESVTIEPPSPYNNKNARLYSIVHMGGGGTLTMGRVDGNLWVAVSTSLVLMNKVYTPEELGFASRAGLTRILQPEYISTVDGREFIVAGQTAMRDAAAINKIGFAITLHDQDSDVWVSKWAIYPAVGKGTGEVVGASSGGGNYGIVLRFNSGLPSTLAESIPITVNGHETKVLSTIQANSSVRFLGNPFMDGLNWIEVQKQKYLFWKESLTLEEFSSPYQKSYAILAAIDDYDRTQEPGGAPTGFAELENMVARARELKSALVRLGFPSENIVELYDTKATSKNIEEELQRFWEGHEHADVDRLIFYFGGHGAGSANSGYLITYDYDSSKPTSTTFLLSDVVYREFQYVKARQFLVALDSCSSGLAVPGSKALAGDIDEKELKQFATLAIIRSDSVPVARNLLVAGTGVQRALWETGGIFTRALIDGLRGKADYTKDNVIQLDELTLYVRNRVLEEARLHAVDQKPSSFNATAFGDGKMVFIPQTDVEQ